MSAGDSGTFSYANPRTVYWAAGSAEQRLEETLAGLNARRVFVISTRSVAANPRLGGRLRSWLGGRYVGEFAAIGQHAPAAAVASAVGQAEKAQPDVLV